MDIRQLRYFVGVVNSGSFTKAASELNIAQSALSLQIRRLEESFGVQLLVRHRAGVDVTNHGLRFLKHARIILDAVADAEAAMANRKSSPAGEVTVGIPSGAARILVSDFMAAARIEIPRVTLKIVEGMTGHLEEWLNAGQLNLALLYRSGTDLGSTEELAREDFYLIAHPEAAPFEATVSLEDLQEFPIAMPMSANNARATMEDVVGKYGYKLNARFEVDSLSTIVKMVAEKQAYSILTLSAVQNELQAHTVKAVKIVNPVVTRSVVVETRPRDARNPAVAATTNVLAKVVRELVSSGDWPAHLPLSIGEDRLDISDIAAADRAR